MSKAPMPTLTPLRKYLVLVTALLATLAPHALAQEAELLAVLRSDATVQEKSTACRQLARIATKEAVPALAALLGDEKLSHMARYALETICDPSVDQALRDALGQVEGPPRLGVIGSLGARRDTGAVDALAGLLKGTDADATQAAARALGCIGNPAAAQALENVLPNASGRNQLAVCEGLLRCAEALTAEEQGATAQAVYDRLRALTDAPPQVRAAALRGAILLRGKEGVSLLLEAIHGPDYALAAAAVRSAMELPGPEITDALVAALSQASAERQGLLIVALADRGEPQVLPAVLQAAQSNDAQLRILALRTLKRVGNASCVPALLEAAAEGSDEVSQAAMESLESLQDKAVDDQVAQQLSESQGKMRIVLIELATRRRIAAATPALWLAADDADPAVRAAALAGLGAMIETADLPKLIARLTSTKQEQEATALDEALREVCLRSADREMVAAQLAAALPTGDGPVKARILETLAVVGGATSLDAVAAAARSSNAELRDAAFRVLGQWTSVDAAPIILDLHKTVGDERLKGRAIRAYVRIARQFDMPADRRAAMCRTALETADRDVDKRLVLEVLLRYPSDEMQAIALEAAKVPALRDEAMLVVMGLASKGINRAELGKALAQAGHQPVQLEIVKAEYGAGEQTKDVTEILRQYAKNYRIIFLPSASYNESFGGDPAPGIVKQLKVQYRIDGKEGEVSLGENATVVLPMPN
ncbi:MAG: HEAT repeat domain-containing protein [Pirellulaceae bacterium]